MSISHFFKRPFLLLVLFVLMLAAIPLAFHHPKAKAIFSVPTRQHYLYVFPQGSMSVYDLDQGFKLVRQVALPTGNTRGVVFSPVTGMLYISHGGTGGKYGPGALLKYNLATGQVVWNVNFPSGVDSMSITPDGKTIYMPDGDQNADGRWFIVDANSGQVTGTIVIGQGDPHNTQVSLDGKRVYLGSVNYNYLTVVDTTTNKIIQKIGPLIAGVRPFTFNSEQTLAFTNATNFIGFQVSSIATGKVLYTVAPKGFPTPPGGLSHGISLSPDEKEIYVMDAPNNYVHVYDVSGLPSVAPQQVADIKLSPITGTQQACTYDCEKEGWVLHSLNGRYVFVADSGDVIDTTTRKIVATLPALADSRIYLEIVWNGNTPYAATSRHGIGHVLQAQDNFQRPNQAHWGMSSDGNVWGGDVNQHVFSISNNTGLVSNGSGAFTAGLGPLSTNSEVLVSGSMSAWNNTSLGAILRWNDNANWYKAYINDSSLAFQTRIKGQLSQLGSVNFAAKAGTAYFIRFRAVGSTLYAKAWPANGTEPANWMLTVQNNAIPSGYPGLRVQIGNGISASIFSYQDMNV